MSEYIKTTEEKRQPSRRRKYTKKQKSKKGIIILIISIIVLIGIAAGIVGKKMYDDYQAKVSAAIDIETFYNGIYIQDTDMSGKTKEQALEVLKPLEPSLRDNINMSISLNDNSIPLTNDNISFNFNTEQVVEQAYTVGREGSRNDRYSEVTSLEETPRCFYIEHTIPSENEALQNYINDLAAQAHVDVQSPFISEFHPGSANPFIPHDGINGVDLDTDKLQSDISTALISKNFSAQIETSLLTTPFTGNIDDLTSQTVLLSQFSTVSTNNANGNHNMALSLSSVNGSIIRPGESFSFNTSTGNSTLASNGYLPAGAISADGSFTDELGGGICQAATTIYGAALRADMNITSRYNHMYPSAYVPIGQDATVDYPSTDFCFKNDSGYSVFIAASMSGSNLSVQIYGRQPDEWDTIEVSSQTTGTIPAPATQYINDASLPLGAQVAKQSAHTGYTASAQKTFYKNGAVVKTEDIASSYYKEKAAIILVGQG